MPSVFDPTIRAHIDPASRTVYEGGLGWVDPEMNVYSNRRRVPAAELGLQKGLAAQRAAQKAAQKFGQPGGAAPSTAPMAPAAPAAPAPAPRDDFAALRSALLGGT